MKQLTRDQAAVIGARTGICFGPFVDIMKYAEKVLGRPVLAHEFSEHIFVEKLKDAARDDLFKIFADD